MAEARAFWVERPGLGAIRPAVISEPGPGEVRVRALFSGISRGTEALVFGGRVPENQHAAMRAPFQEGAFPGPVKYGYASVGRVEAGPEALLGRAVFCLFPHQTAYVVPVEAVAVLPEGVPPARAVLAANMETAINIIWDAAPVPGERIAVIGAGVVGLLVASLLARIPGCAVTLIDPDPRRRDLAEAFGTGFAAPDQAAGETGECDLVIHASGAPEGLVTALALAGFEARIIEASWFGTTPVPLPLGEAFHARRLSILSSQVGAVAPRQRPRWSHARRLALALTLLREAVYDRLVTGEDDFEALPAVMARLAAAPDGALCHRIRYAAGGAERASAGPAIC